MYIWVMSQSVLLIQRLVVLAVVSTIVCSRSRSGWEADKGEDQTQTPTPASPDPERVLGAGVDSRADKLILALA